mmetsp:Transcript_92909/g.289082  ORF Transcript_92909/g.289082 Transcript_92909/m.289082 type:complete len:207 (-) Transcript_92909:1277-1897(-)
MPEEGVVWHPVGRGGQRVREAPSLARTAVGLGVDEALVARVLAEVVVDVVVQRRPLEEARRQPHGEEVLLAVPVPDACAPGAGADAPDDAADGLLHGHGVHRRLVGLVPARDVLVEVTPLGVTEVVHVFLHAAHVPRQTAGARGGHGYECAGHHQDVFPVDGHALCPLCELLVEPVLRVDAAAGGSRTRLPGDVAHVPPRPQQREG